MKKIIAGNWKQNGKHKTSIQLVKNIISGIKKNKCKHEVIIFPPSIYLSSLQGIVNKSDVKIGAQNVSAYNDGAFTGEISSSMLKDTKIQYCLVGHSERRHVFNESPDMLFEKVIRLFENNIKVIYCIGETLDQFKNKKTKSILNAQVKKIFNKLKIKSNNIIIAYEPVWAIGTGLVPSDKDLIDAFKYIRNTINKFNPAYKSIKILYGGSVSPENAHSLMKTPHMDGLLIGGASLNAKKFIDICSTI